MIQLNDLSTNQYSRVSSDATERLTRLADNCILCAMLKGSAADESYRVIQRDDLCTVLLSRHPEQPGHTLVVPHVHVSTFWELRNPQQQHLLEIAKRIESAIREATECPRVAIQMTGLTCPEHVYIDLRPITPVEMSERKMVCELPKEASRDDLRHWADKIKECLSAKRPTNIADYREAMRLNSKFADVYYVRAQDKAKTADDMAAIAAFDQTKSLQLSQ